MSRPLYARWFTTVRKPTGESCASSDMLLDALAAGRGGLLVKRKMQIVTRKRAFGECNRAAHSTATFSASPSPLGLSGLLLAGIFFSFSGFGFCSNLDLTLLTKLLVRSSSWQDDNKYKHTFPRYHTVQRFYSCFQPAASSLAFFGCTGIEGYANTSASKQALPTSHSLNSSSLTSSSLSILAAAFSLTSTFGFSFSAFFSSFSSTTNTPVETTSFRYSVADFSLPLWFRLRIVLPFPSRYVSSPYASIDEAGISTLYFTFDHYDFKTITCRLRRFFSAFSSSSLLAPTFPACSSKTDNNWAKPPINHQQC